MLSDWIFLAMRIVSLRFFCVALAFISLVTVNESLAEGTKATLTIVDETGKSHEIAEDAIAALPRIKATVEVHGVSAEYEGASLVDVLKSAGVGFGNELKGRRAGTFAVLEATDGYQIVLSLLEFDPATTDTRVILVDRKDGKRLDKNEAPYRIVIPGDKRPIRWIRMVHVIYINNLRDSPKNGQASEPK